MRRRLLLWFVLLCCVAAVTLLVVGQRAGSRSRQQAEAGASERGQSEGTAEPTEPGSPAPRATEPRASAGGQDVVLPLTDQTLPVRDRAARVETAARDSPTQPQIRTAAQPRLAPISNQEPEAKAEFWSYPPLMQQIAATNFLRAMEELTSAKSELGRYIALSAAAKSAFVFGKTEDARSYASELLALDEKFKGAVGNAVHDGNLVLGRIAALEGQMEEAKHCLLEAGKTAGSPALGTFGPNMSLARDLLQNGEQETVLQYFDLCRKFWGSGNDKLTQWTEEVRAGTMPDFGANLFY